MSIVFFILLIGPLIFFHELGHFVAARIFGVGVIRFSIGFGPRLFGFTRKGTEYVIGALPLGGYVRMVGMEPGETADLPPAEKSRALWNKPIWQRAIIVLAGPLANLILPLPIFILVYSLTEARLPPTVGTVIADSPAAGEHLKPGDHILTINGEAISYFDEIQQALADAPENAPTEVVVERLGQRITFHLEPEVINRRDQWVGLRIVEQRVIGVTPTTEGPVLSIGSPAGVAAQAGLQTFDRIIEVGGTTVHTFLELDQAARSATGPVELLAMRPMALDESFGDLFVETPVRLTMNPSLAAPGQGLGWGPAGMCLYSVQAGSPAAEAGLQRGDEILTVGGRRYNVFTSLLAQLQQSAGQPLEVTYRRSGEEHTTTLTPRELTVTGDFNQGVTETFVGMASLMSAENYPHAYDHFPLVPMSMGERLSYGFSMGFKALIGFILGIVVGVWQLISGQVGLDNLGGPLMIFDIAGRAGSAGAAPFLRIMALISINLGILNLLPIPVLDGGNLLLFAIEAVKRGPITMRTRQVANYIGLVFIITIFILVFKNDIERYWHHVAEFFD